ncbi:uroporphyrinogen-III synthase [Thalassococcus sp. CAU 1522]|uniref:Uroporphyrinogen-III synthase n=1 Tax=Thalassococcus arenae TaxID=2851652 RepID=A0ABS6N674_9RHOB|nr:uroporphyrinogen-III synthase [Thalassococcus arenae]MBV2359524.1 uroporphyrinogen-III synthase [Thalassococcus arenae]
MSDLPWLLMTRPAPDSARFADQLKTQGETGFRMIVSPLMQIEPCGSLPSMEAFRGLIFTSANGVAAYLDLNGPRDLPVFAVGKATEKAARRAGFATQSADGDSAALIEMLRHRRPDAPLLHLRGAHTSGDIAETLTELGLETAEAVIYDQRALSISRAAASALSGSEPVVAPIFSPRTAALFASHGRITAPLLVAAMSEAVAKAALPLHSRVLRVATQPDARAMTACVVALLREARAMSGRDSAV